MTTERDRYRGCLLGGAVGDALGAGIEFSSLAEIRSEHGPAGVTGYVPCYGRGRQRQHGRHLRQSPRAGLGATAIDADLLDELEGRDVITQIADDLFDVFASGQEPSTRRYPAG